MHKGHTLPSDPRVTVDAYDIYRTLWWARVPPKLRAYCTRVHTSAFCYGIGVSVPGVTGLHFVNPALRLMENITEKLF